MLQYRISSIHSVVYVASGLFNGVSRCGQAWVFSGASWVLFGTPRPPSPMIHYTLPRFILKDPGLQPLGNHQKQGAIQDVMINPKITLGLTRGG